MEYYQSTTRREADKTRKRLANYQHQKQWISDFHLPGGLKLNNFKVTPCLFKQATKTFARQILQVNILLKKLSKCMLKVLLILCLCSELGNMQLSCSNNRNLTSSPSGEPVMPGVE